MEKMLIVSDVASPKSVLPLTVKSEAVTIAPVVPLTVKLEVSTAIPPFRLTRVVVVAPLPVTVARVEELAMVITPALPVVVISSPAVKVNVPPWETAWVVVPEVAPAVQRDPPDTRQVEHPISPRAERVTGEVAETATVPDALGNVHVLSETVKSDEVIIPAKVLVAVPDWGRI